MSKKVILLNWNYDRLDWVEPFYKLQEDFEFHIISKRKKEDEEREENVLTVHYWSSYSSASELLKTVNPDKVVFMGITRMMNILLLYAAKKMGIKTFYFQHGLIYDAETYTKMQSKKSRNDELNDTHVSLIDKLKDIHELLQLTNPCITYKTIKYIYDRNRLGKIIYTKYKNLSFLQPDYLLVYTNYNAKLFKEIYELDHNEKLIEIGNPTLDKFFNYNGPTEKKDYLLLIDTPLVSNSKTDGLNYTKSHAKQFYQAIYKKATDLGLNLYIKRHPYCYDDDHFIYGPKVIYVDHCEEEYLIKLLYQATKILSFNSTLAIPSIAINDTILINTGNNFINTMKETGIDVIEFDSPNLDKITTGGSGINNEDFIKKYIYKKDGQSLQRLKDVFNHSF